MRSLDGGAEGAVSMSHCRETYSAERVRGMLSGRRDVAKKNMMGGLFFMVKGGMWRSVSGRGGLLVRIDPENQERLLRGIACAADANGCAYNEGLRPRGARSLQDGGVAHRQGTKTHEVLMPAAVAGLLLVEPRREAGGAGVRAVRNSCHALTSGRQLHRQDRRLARQRQPCSLGALAASRPREPCH